MRRQFLRTLQVLLLTIALAGCGGAPAVPIEIKTPVPPTPTASVTPDPCGPEQIEAEVQKIHRHMREFDDASMLASGMPRNQLSNAITDLQRIRREADDESIPDCLANLQTYQVEHMNSVINTLLAFLNGTEQQTVDQGVQIAREQHDQYTVELARLLGLTVVPAAAASTPTETPTP